MPTVDNSRASIIKRFKAQVAAGLPIIGGGAGTGISAKSEEAGGVDLLVIYNSGRYRMAGRGSMAGYMPFGNANQIVKEMAMEVLPVVTRTPVLAGVCAFDPFIIPRHLLAELKALGFAGVQNFPTMGLIDGNFRLNLEETGMTYASEVDCIALASQMDMLTTPYVFNLEEARLMTRAGADIIVAHMGCTLGGAIGVHSYKSLDTCVDEIKAIVDLCKSINPEVFVLCHGGPIAMPADAAHIIRNVPGVDGFYGASSMERLPTEIAIAEQVRQFKAIRLGK